MERQNIIWETTLCGTGAIFKRSHTKGFPHIQNNRYHWGKRNTPKTNFPKNYLSNANLIVLCLILNHLWVIYRIFKAVPWYYVRIYPMNMYNFLSTYTSKQEERLRGAGAGGASKLVHIEWTGLFQMLSLLGFRILNWAAKRWVLHLEFIIHNAKWIYNHFP